MTVKEMEAYFADRWFFPNPDQQVQFVLADEGTPFEKGQRLEMRGTTVPDTGKGIVVLRPATKRKYMFSLKFEANPVIEAETFDDAEAKAREMMEHVGVKNLDTDAVDESYVEQEPYFLEEVKE